MEPKYPKQLVELAPGMDKNQIIASVCRSLAKANLNGMLIASFSNLANSKHTVTEVIDVCAQWVTLSGKEHYGQTQENQATKEPDVSSTT